MLNKSGGGQGKPIEIGDASVLLGRSPARFTTEGGTVLVIGLKPLSKYLVETDDEEMCELATDRAGTLVLSYTAGRAAGVRIRESMAGNTIELGGGK